MTGNTINNGKTTRNAVLILMVLVALVLVVFGVKDKKDGGVGNINQENTNGDENKNVIELCFANTKVAGDPKNALEDAYILRLLLDGEKASGELNFLPAEKDKKVGKFAGTVGAVEPIAMARTVDAIWDTFAEGMNVKEELRIIFGEGTASIGGGAMEDRGDGVYVYTDKLNLNYDFQLSDVDCKMLDERANVEEYLKKNISTLAPVPASLGGTWFVIRVIVDPTLNTGHVVYEDGHNEEKRAFSYEPDQNGNIVSLKVI